MSILSDRFPILAKPLAGWVVFFLSASTLLLVWVFQEPTELPKLIAWFLGVGISLAIILFAKSLPKLNIPKPALVLLGLLTIFLILGSFFTYDVRNSVFGLFPRYTGSLLFFVSWILGILIFSSVGRSDFLKLLKFYAYLAVLVAVWGISQSFGFGYYGGLEEGVRSSAPSFIGNPNFSAMFIATALPLLVWMAQSKVKWASYLHWLWVGISLVSLVIFNSRGAFLAVGISLAIYVAMSLWKKAWRNSIVIILMTIIFAGTAGLFYYQTRVNVVQKYSDESNQTTNSRLLLWSFTGDYIAKNPIFGSGLANFFIAFRANNNSAFTNHEWFDDAHNVVLQFAASSGLVTTACLLGLVGYALLIFFRKYLLDQEVGIEVALIGGVLAWFVAGSFTPVALPNWTFLALLLATGWQVSGKSVELGTIKFIKPTTAVLSIIFIVLGLSMLVSELFLWQGRYLLERGEYSKAEKYSKIAATAFPLSTNAYITYMSSQLHLKQDEVLLENIPYFLSQHPLSSGLHQVAADYYAQMYFDTNNIKYQELSFQEIDKMIELNSNYSFPYRIAALHHIRMKDYAGALKYSNQSLVFNTEDFNSWIMNARIHYELGNRETTYRALEQSFRLVQDVRIKYALKRFKEGAPLKDIVFPLEFN